MKKTITILMAGILTCALVLTTCESVLTKDIDGLYDDTLINSDVNILRENRKQIGEISGTITLTDVPNPAPQMFIRVSNHYDNNHWSSRSEFINLSYDNSVNLTWSIPVYEDDGFSPSNGNFILYVIPTDIDDIDIDKFFWVDIPITPYISSANTNGINLGTVSIKSVTLSGTINITHNGQPVQYAFISARNVDGQSIGFSFLDLPVANAPWSMTVAANSNVTFGVWGHGNDEWHYEKRNLSPIHIYEQDISGIAINVGDIKTITLSGTISVTYKGQQVPLVYIEPSTQDYIWQHDYVDLSSPANGASWSITVEVPASTKTVYFDVLGCNKDEILFGRLNLSPISVYNQDISGITLNLGDITNYDYDAD